MHQHYVCVHDICILALSVYLMHISLKIEINKIHCLSIKTVSVYKYLMFKNLRKINNNKQLKKIPV